jgi:hypothetical protein
MFSECGGVTSIERLITARHDEAFLPGEAPDVAPQRAICVTTASDKNRAGSTAVGKEICATSGGRRFAGMNAQSGCWWS